MACGLDFNSGSRFAVLPPHFQNSSVLSHDEWMQIVPDYNKYCIGFQACIPYFLASLVFHYDWIMEKDVSGNFKNIDNNHPILTSRLFTSNIVTRLKPLVIPPLTNGRCSTTGMTATGIPPHIDQARQLEELRDENRLLRQQLVAQTDMIFGELPAKVTENIIANVNIEGVQQISRNDLERMMSHMEANIINQLQVSQVVQQSAIDVVAEATTSEHIHPDGFKSWHWGGQLHRPIPETWSFPKGTLKRVIDLFITGIPSEYIRPFRRISVKSLKRKDQQYFTRAEYIFKEIKLKSLDRHMIDNEHRFETMSVANWDVVFEEVFGIMVAEINADRESLGKGQALSKPQAISFITFYDHLRNIGKPKKA